MNAQAQRTRDRDATMARLVRAVGTLLAREGFMGLGVNALAREAGVDKVLIYRYFGNLDGLIEAFANSREFWPTIDELTGGDEAAFRRLPPVERAVRYFRNYLRAIRSRPLTHEILAWETLGPNEATARLDEARRRLAHQSWALFDDVSMADVPLALPAILIASVQYLAMRARTSPNFAGVEIRNEAGWQQIEQAQELMIRGALERVGLGDA